MANYKSSLGRPIDMQTLIAKNEHVRAVGNMKVNARGDTIDSFGKVILPATNNVTTQYNKTVNNQSANVKKNVSKPQENLEKQEKIEVYPEELDDVFEQDQIDIESIKKNETKD